VYVSGDNGANWMAFNNGFPYSDVRTLAIVGPDLYAGVSGWSLWKRDTSEITSTQNLSAPNNAFDAFPNPTNGNLNISVSNSFGPITAVSLYNLIGDKVFEQTDFKGNNEHFSLNFSSLQKGIYVIQLISDQKAAVRKIVLE
jgi:hypothetical protein